MIPMFVKAPDADAKTAVAYPTPTGPTVMQILFRRLHIKLINALQAGREDEVYEYTRRLVFVGTVIRPKPKLEAVKPPHTPEDE